MTEWLNFSTFYTLLTSDRGNEPFSLGKGGKLTVGAYPTEHSLVIRPEIRFGEPPYGVGIGSFLIWPNDPRFQEPVVVDTVGGVRKIVGPVSGGGLCWVYRASNGQKGFGVAIMEQLAGDLDLPENKAIAMYLPKLSPAFPGEGYSVKAAGAPWGRPWSAGDTITVTLQQEIP